MFDEIIEIFVEIIKIIVEIILLTDINEIIMRYLK